MYVVLTQKYLPLNCFKRDQTIYYLPLLHAIRTEEKFRLLHRTALIFIYNGQISSITLTNASLSLLFRFLFSCCYCFIVGYAIPCGQIHPLPYIVNIIFCTKLMLIKFMLILLMRVAKLHIWQVYSMAELWPATINICTCLFPSPTSPRPGITANSSLKKVVPK